MGTDAEAQAYVISANIHRRHLTPEKRRELIASLLQADPSQSSRQIAEATKTSHNTVESVRAGLEATGQIDQLTETKGKDGKTRKKKKSDGGKKQKVRIEYPEVTDAKTAANAYSVLEEHLVDALQDLNDKSSLAHADEYAQKTIAKLQKRLAELQPKLKEVATA